MQDTTYKTRPDGSIDTAFYMAKGRMERGLAAHELTGKVKSAASDATVGTLRRLMSSLFRAQGSHSMLRSPVKTSQ